MVTCVPTFCSEQDMPRLHFLVRVIGGGREHSFHLSDPDCYLLRNDNYFKENQLGASHSHSSSVRLAGNGWFKSGNYYRFKKRAEMTHMVSLIKLIQKPPDVVLILCFSWMQQCINTCNVRGQVLVN